MSLAVVSIEAVEVLRPGLHQRRQFGAVGKEDIGVAIVVEVEGGDAAGHGLDEIFSFGRGIVQDKIEPGVG